MKVLWDGEGAFGNPPKSYKTYANAVKAAHKVLGCVDIRVVIACTPEGRFFPVAIGMKAIDYGVQHLGICVAA